MKIPSILRRAKRLIEPPAPPRIVQVKATELATLCSAYAHSQEGLKRATDRLLASTDDLIEAQRRIGDLLRENAQMGATLKTARNQASRIEALEAKLADRETENRSLASINAALKSQYLAAFPQGAAHA